MWILFIGFIDFMMKGKSLLDYINLFFPNKYEINDRIILNFLSVTWNEYFILWIESKLAVKKICLEKP